MGSSYTRIDADVDGDDDLPDMAVGRFPVTEPSEAAAIVEKTVRYQAQPEFGPWRSRLLWVTSEQPGFLQMSDQVPDVTGLAAAVRGGDIGRAVLGAPSDNAAGAESRDDQIGGMGDVDGP